MKNISKVFAVLIGGVVFSPAFSEQNLAPLYEARSIGQKPIQDKQNRTYYIVDLKESAYAAVPEARDPKKPKKHAERHTDKTQNLYDALEDEFAIEVVDGTSWVGLSVFAYLNNGQLNKIRKDPRVEMVTEVTTMQYSQTPPWSNSPLGSPPTPALQYLADVTYFQFPQSEVASWGHVATNGKVSTAPTKTRVYVLDSGVGFHVDLNVVQRVNPSCRRDNPYLSGQDCTNPIIPVVGCYAHSTHVAGIIGAHAGGYAGQPARGVKGINAGAEIYSVSTQNSVNDSANCVDGVNMLGWEERDEAIRNNILATTVMSGLDWIRNDLYLNSRYRPGVVNMSFNGPMFGFPTMRTKMSALATGSLGYVGSYAGAFIAQSAGNKKVDACATAYAPLNTAAAAINDGIMVVGALRADGTPVVTPFSDALYGGGDPGSNYGSCVDIWAPGDGIWSTWGGGKWDVEPQIQGVPYNKYALLSGTSMAAPHVAGAAAWFAETYNLSTAAQIEQYVRAYMVPAGAHPITGQAISRVRLP